MFRKPAYLLHRPDDGACGGDGGERHGDVLCDAFATLLLAVLRLHVHDVVLLQIEAGGVEDVAAAEVVDENLPFLADFADDGHLVHTGVGGEVAGVGNGLEEGDAVAPDGVGAVAADSTEDGIFEVEEVDGDEGILDVVALDDAVLDELRHLGECAALDVDLSEHGEVDVAVNIHAVTLVVAVGSGGDFTGAADANGSGLGVEGECEFGLLAADSDAQPVVAVDNGLMFALERITFAHLHVLQIHEVLTADAGGQCQQC